MTPMDCSTPGFLSITNPQSFFKLMSIMLVMSSNHLMLCCPFSSCLQSFPASCIFANESVLHIRWPEYRSFSISPSSEYSGLISFRIDWFDLLAVHRTLQHHSSPTSQFESISSSVLSLLYSPTLTSVHEYWKNHSFDYTDLCQQSNVSF